MVFKDWKKGSYSALSSDMWKVIFVKFVPFVQLDMSIFF